MKQFPNAPIKITKEKQNEQKLQAPAKLAEERRGKKSCSLLFCISQFIPVPLQPFGTFPPSFFFQFSPFLLSSSISYHFHNYAFPFFKFPFFLLFPFSSFPLVIPPPFLFSHFLFSSFLLPPLQVLFASFPHFPLSSVTDCESDSTHLLCLLITEPCTKKDYYFSLQERCIHLKFQICWRNI